MRTLIDLNIGLRLAIRARFFTISLLLSFSVAGVAWMAAQFSGRQPATIALDVGISFIRLVLPIVTIILVQELLSKEFDRKLFLTSLSYPRPRHTFLLGRFFSIYFLCTALLITLAVCLGICVYFIAKNYLQATPINLGYPYLITIAFIAIDTLLITAFATLLSVIATSSSFVIIGTLGFMFAARSFSAIILMLQMDSSLVTNADHYQSSLSLLHYLLPNLYALDVRAIALYSNISLLSSNWAWHLSSISIYSVALIATSIWLLNRKNLG